MSTSADRFDERVRREADRVGNTIVRRGELLRHPVYTRVLHWLVAISFILALLSGFAIYSPWLFRFLSPLFAGGPTARLLHPWFGLFFVAFFLFQFINWLTPMWWTSADSRWLGRIKRYTANEDKFEPADVGYFNGGQKIYFWLIVLSVVLFLVSGPVMWCDNIFPRWIVAASYVIHDLAALLMLGAFLIHIYEGTAAMPGTFRAMTNGTVTRKWAWTHHPAWYRDVTGRDPSDDMGRERDRLEERARRDDELEREQDIRNEAEQDRMP